MTTDVTDFWQRVPADERYSVICLPLPNERQHEIPDLVRQLFRLQPFRTKAARMGRVARVSPSGVQFYQVGDASVQSIPWEQPERRLRSTFRLE